MPTIIEMVNHTRLDCVIGAVGRHARRASRRRCTTRAHRERVRASGSSSSRSCRTCSPTSRRVRGRDRPSMMRLARAYDDDAPSEERPFARLATAVVKYWVCKRTPVTRRRGARVPRRQRLRRGVGPAAPLPRGAAERHLGRLGQRHLPRRAARDGPRARGRVDAFFAELDRGRGRRRGSTRSSTQLRARAHRLAGHRARARGASSSAWRSRCRARCSSATATRPSPSAFCASRLGGEHGLAFGTLPPRRRLPGDHRARLDGLSACGPRGPSCSRSASRRARPVRPSERCRRRGGRAAR